MLVAIVAAVTLASCLLVEGSERLEVQILQGRLSGVKETSVKGRPFYAFRNIPFAKPPVGTLRFKDPEPAGKWKGTRDASPYPPKCVQPPDGAEDCLYLNVYTPKVEVQARLPVMVWIHGGAFFVGESSLYPPHAILERDVVLVVIQYRLGIFGFLSTEDEVIPGNFGLKDQTLALRWVQQNIGHFGGDPNQVTIFGESAGGASANYQMLIPEAKGLFSRAILQSGCALNPWAQENSHGQLARRFGGALGCSLEKGSEDFLGCMQKVPAETLNLALIATIEFVVAPLLMAPRVDGKFIPNRPEDLIASGNFNKVPIISGVVQNEGAMATLFIFSDAKMKEKFTSNFSAIPMSMFFKGKSQQAVEQQTHQMFEHFVGNANFDDKDAEAITQLYSDFAFFVGHDVMSLMSSRHHPVYTYDLRHRSGRSLFTDQINFDKTDPSLARQLRSWIAHADELFYLFDGSMGQPLEDPTDLALRDIIVALWTNFAYTANPTPDNSLGFKWERATESSFKHLALKPQPYMEEDTRAERRKFWLSLPVFQTLRKALQESD